MLITLLWSRLFLAHARPGRLGMEQSELDRGPGGAFGTARMGYRKSLSQKRRTREVLRKRAQTVGEGAARAYSVTQRNILFFSPLPFQRQEGRLLRAERLAWLSSPYFPEKTIIIKKKRLLDVYGCESSQL